MRSVLDVNNAIALKLTKHNSVKTMKMLEGNKNIKSLKLFLDKIGSFLKGCSMPKTKSVREWFSIINIKFISVEITKFLLQSLKSKKKRNFHRNISDYFDQTNQMRQSNTF